jgi:hypothetical protein
VINRFRAKREFLGTRSVTDAVEEPWVSGVVSSKAVRMDSRATTVSFSVDDDFFEDSE